MTENSNELESKKTDEFLRETYELLIDGKIDSKEKERRLYEIHRRLRRNDITIEELEEKYIPIEKLLDMFPDVTEELVKKSLDHELLEDGILLSNKIRKFSKKYHLIFPFNEENLKPAAYELTVGNEYSIRGENKKLTGKDDKIVIPPFEIAVIKIREIINMPRFLIGRWNIRVYWAYKGLLWVGGPQVDPGWVGHLFCPIYNLSDKNVELKLGDKIAVIDFVKTTQYYKTDDIIKYPRPPKRKKLADYNPELSSALFSEVGKRIEEVNKQIDDIEKRVSRAENMVGLVIMSIAVLFTTLAILVSAGKESGGLQLWACCPWWIKWYTLIGIPLSFVAITLSLLDLYRKNF